MLPERTESKDETNAGCEPGTTHPWPAADQTQCYFRDDESDQERDGKAAEEPADQTADGSGGTGRVVKRRETSDNPQPNARGRDTCHPNDRIAVFHVRSVGCGRSRGTNFVGFFPRCHVSPGYGPERRHQTLRIIKFPRPRSLLHRRFRFVAG
jgi:hypothetical protein